MRIPYRYLSTDADSGDGRLPFRAERSVSAGRHFCSRSTRRAPIGSGASRSSSPVRRTVMASGRRTYRATHPGRADPSSHVPASLRPGVSFAQGDCMSPAVIAQATMPAARAIACPAAARTACASGRSRHGTARTSASPTVPKSVSSVTTDEYSLRSHLLPGGGDGPTQLGAGGVFAVQPGSPWRGLCRDGPPSAASAWKVPGPWRGRPGGSIAPGAGPCVGGTSTDAWGFRPPSPVETTARAFTPMSTPTGGPGAARWSARSTSHPKLTYQRPALSGTVAESTRAAPAARSPASLVVGSLVVHRAQARRGPLRR